MNQIFNFLYIVAMVLLSPWLLWRLLVQKKSREGFGEKFLGLVPVRDSNLTGGASPLPCIWLHAVSVGEVKLLQPVVAKIQRQRPGTEIVISTTTMTGRHLASELFPDLTTFYSPLDFSWAVRRALRRIRPDALVMAELELWPNTIDIARRQGIAVCVINGRLSARSARGYRKFAWLVQPMFRRLTWVGAQSPHYANRFIENGCDSRRVDVTGSVKFDGVEISKQNAGVQAMVAVARQAGIHPRHFTFVAGSTQLEEDLMAVEAWQSLSEKIPTLRLILVPRHPERVKSLVKELDQRGVSTVLRSSISDSESGSVKIPSASRNRSANGQASVLIVDVIGELSWWWGVGNSGFVGGSFGGRGGQSMIEPAGLAVPVCFGPHTENFADTVGQLIDNEAAEIIHDTRQMAAFIQWSCQMEHLAAAMGQRASAVVQQNVGAADRTVAGIFSALGQTKAGDFSQVSTRKAA